MSTASTTTVRTLVTGAPAGAPVREDLTFLRRRARPAAPAPAAEEPVAAGPTAPAPALALAPPSGATPPTRPGRTPLPPLLAGLPGVGQGERLLLARDAPVVQLTRVQSGVGGLRGELHTAVDASVVVAYELADRTQGVVREAHPYGPDERRPVVHLAGTRFTVDLRQARELRRFVVVVRPAEPAAAVEGVLVVTTTGGSRLEIPLDPSDAGPSGPDPGRTSTVALTGHLVRGALVLRAEHARQVRPLRDALAAYGYRRLSWRDADTVLAG
ncbi:hypothetical protein [Luteimicrobium sp. DT211]|uniref:hypothetical protein n=1 Tax=Luteimicrobium sp. DT211 TaxID=3393412 RepID=UPI003CF3170D